VATTETDEGVWLAEATMKAFTGGDEISARGLYENLFTFRPTHSLLVATNYRPRVRCTDHAIWRRIAVVPFGVKVPPERQVDRYWEILAARGNRTRAQPLTAGAPLTGGLVQMSRPSVPFGSAAA
jgi:phage/plasmid-associated DNA primase